MLRRLRLEAELRLEDVSRMSGITLQHLSVLERGEMEPTVRTLRRLGRVYFRPVWEMVAMLEAERLSADVSRDGQPEVSSREAVIT